MTKRADIKNERLVYTEKLGWLDLGHANGDDARKLMISLYLGDNTTKESHFIVRYVQYMGRGRNYGTSIKTRWRVRRGLSLHDMKRVALTIMMYTTHSFESYQDSFPFTWFSDSGYSGEDLISNLFGFYQAVNDINYLPQVGVVSKDEAFKRWDYYGPIGKYKNKTFKPLLFPDPEKYPNNARPYHASLPSFLNTIAPISDIKTSQDVMLIEDASWINVGKEYAGISVE
ncbi:hypothetical protein [Xenorhabdus bovienii]|uniref:hypothetical protein n=1 Tax=Xenorhabdus bovienii TaxID=40576 RepID=UPI0023B315CC|nr:hypothetical protein [Xenorhabdus bovienii]MDE9430757.1 hypothetical protein [Xenorhabdus bovienii]MDE9435240.1 hypothetical protein [Xenorhabdus bovienii]MDE9461914.1 hypothetical protein [Xenorhabdus bovienii]MDE9468967.1 hypothetical protein [Xenorhabdus bovienii]MDE9488400.1 hypothetical protein [Xenorhabdus bovienii]